jgi:hypothetical protein
VTAVLGIPAIVAGLGAGLDRSTFTNMAEAREAAYEAGLIPMQRILGEDIRFQLLADFGDDPFAFRFGFDLSKVRVLQEDLYRQAQRHDLGDPRRLGHGARGAPRDRARGRRPRRHLPAAAERPAGRAQHGRWSSMTAATGTAGNATGTATERRARPLERCLGRDRRGGRPCDRP